MALSKDIIQKVKTQNFFEQKEEKKLDESENFISHVAYAMASNGKIIGYNGIILHQSTQAVSFSYSEFNLETGELDGVSASYHGGKRLPDDLASSAEAYSRYPRDIARTRDFIETEKEKIAKLPEELSENYGDLSSAIVGSQQTFENGKPVMFSKKHGMNEIFMLYCKESLVLGKLSHQSESTFTKIKKIFSLRRDK